MEQLNWQNKHITSNVPQYKYGICRLALSVGAAGILLELHKQLPAEAKHDQEPKQASIEGSTEEHQKVRKSKLHFNVRQSALLTELCYRPPSSASGL